MIKKVIFALLSLQIILFPYATANTGEENDNDIIYSLMVDRFYDGETNNNIDVNRENPVSYHGGDFQGIKEQLAFIDKLNFTVIQLSPIFENEPGGYHGEWVRDYFSINPHFGTLEQFKELVDEIHNRGMKVIIEFPVMEEESADNILEAAKWWLENTDIDGYKMTYVKELSVDFWIEFVKEIKSERSDFLLIAEDNRITKADLAEYENIGFDRIVYYPLMTPLRTAFASLDNSLTDLFNESFETSKLNIQLEVFFDNQYSERFTKDMVEKDTYPVSAWKRALTYLYTIPQTPVVFYGTEIALNGGEPPENTPLMNFQSNEELMEFMTRIGKVRQQQEALRKGDMELLYEKDGMLIFKRQYNEEIVVVAINNTTLDQTVHLPIELFPEGKELRGLMGDHIVRSSDTEFTIVLDREQVEIFKVLDESGYNLYFILSIFVVFGIFILFMFVAWKRGKNRLPE